MIRHDRTPGLRLYMLIFLTAVAVRSTLAAVTYRPTVAYTGEAESSGASLAQKGEFAPAAMRSRRRIADHSTRVSSPRFTGCSR